MKSLWREQMGTNPSVACAEYSADFNRHRDVIVVGAGIAGLLIAYYLQEQGRDVLVLEADEIASGQTDKTTAKITSQHGLKYQRLVKTVGAERAKMYARANETAVREYERLIESHGMECQFERVPAYLYTAGDETVLKKEAEAAAYLGIDAFYTKDIDLPFPAVGAVCFQNQAQFSPLQFVRCLSSELEIMEHTRVIAVRGNKVIAEDAVMTADKIVLASHYPFLNVPGFYFLRQHQERSHVLALSGCDRIKGMFYGVERDAFSLRQAGDYLLLGGCASRIGENKCVGAYETLERAAKQYFPGCKVEKRWSAQDCMTHDGIPFIGRYSMFTPHLYVATGFQKWGMTSSMAAAMILRDELCGIKNPHMKVFRPQRLNFRASFVNALCDAGASVKSLSKGFFHRPKKRVESLLNGQGGIVKIEGRRYACYRDESGIIHKISARCPHMGCELTWNPEEKSWDCPCHGSRFDISGRLLDNPSKRDGGI